MERTMEKLTLNRLQMPVITGTPRLPAHPAPAEAAQSFDSVLRGQMEKAEGLNFSKHAINRVQQRGIDLSGDSLTRLTEGVKIAESRGLDDTLILVDQTAFIVSVKNSTVVTAVDGRDLRGNVFTNIDGTVII